jgi:putative ABC transport system ATP-binding protein
LISSDQAEPLIRVDRLTKIYKFGAEDLKALNCVSFSIQPGEFVAVMGASGSGKSTLMNIFGCLDYPTSGDYYLGGVHINRLNRNQLAQIRNSRIGFVFQGFNLLARTTALENVVLPLIYHRGEEKIDPVKRATAVLKELGLGDRMNHIPSQLSGGQQQRVAIARALVNHPALILADEPTGNLDSRTSIEVMSIFRELNEKGITIILVTHEPDIATFAKRVIELRDGEILRDEAQTKPAAHRIGEVV